MKSSHQCEFFEEESRGYFRFQSINNTDKYVQFFKGGGKPFRENQKKHKKVCSEFVKAHSQPVITQPLYNYPFDPMPRSHVPVISALPVPATTTTTTTTTSTTTSTTTTTVAPSTTTTRKATHKLRHNRHRKQKAHSTEEFSSSLDTTRHFRHQKHQEKQLVLHQQPTTQRTRKNRKNPLKNNNQNQGQGQRQRPANQHRVTSTSPRSRNGGQGRKKPNQKQFIDREPRRMLMNAEELEQEHLRAYALAKEKMLQSQRQRQADFMDDYWNDDNMIGTNDDDEAKWGAKAVSKRHQSLAVMTGKKQQHELAAGKPSATDSILKKRPLGMADPSGELKGHSRRKQQQKRPTAHSKDNFIIKSSGSGSTSSNGSGSKRQAPKLNNHHHHPDVRARGS